MKAAHLKILNALDVLTLPHGEMCVGFKPISRESGVEDLREIRRIVRHLARKGMAQYFRALITDEGEFAGAGYCITREGKAAISEISRP